MYRLICKMKICLYIGLIVYQVVDPCLTWYNFYVLFRDKTFSGVSIDTKHINLVEVVFCFSCVTGTFLGVCMVVAYVYYIHYHRHCLNRNSFPSASFKDGVFKMIRNSAFDNEKFDLRYVELELWGTVLEVVFRDGIHSAILFWMRKSLVNKPDWHFLAFAVFRILAHVKQIICFFTKFVGWGAGEKRCCSHSCQRRIAIIIGLIVGSVCLGFAIAFLIDATKV